jgi:hypothetical protein
MKRDRRRLREMKTPQFPFAFREPSGTADTLIA